MLFNVGDGDGRPAAGEDPGALPAEIPDRLRRVIAPARDLACPDPEAVRLAKLTGPITRRTG
jgi:hypothetical protein